MELIIYFSGSAVFNIFQGISVAPGPNPPNLVDKQLSFLPPVIFDRAPFGSHFGNVITDAQPSYKQVRNIIT